MSTPPRMNGSATDHHGAADRVATDGDLLRGRVALRILRGRHPLRYYTFVPESFEAGGRIVALVHGISRNARELALTFAVHARRSGVILVAPVFSREDCRDYQQLGWTGRGWRADNLLEAVVREVGADARAERETFALFGYSGGAQLAHRFALAKPAKVSRLTVCAAGYYTMPDPNLSFPYGLDCAGLGINLPRESRAELHFDLEGFLHIPTLAIVGKRDKGRGSKLRSSPELDALQGRHRVRRAKRWVAALREAAAARQINGQLEYAGLPKAGHDFADCVRRGLVDMVWPWLTAPVPMPPVQDEQTAQPATATSPP